MAELKNGGSKENGKLKVEWGEREKERELAEGMLDPFLNVFFELMLFTGRQGAEHFMG